MVVRVHVSCLFASAPVADCGREIVIPPPSLASTWPLALILLSAAALCGYAYLRTIYPAPINWEDGDDRPPSPEDQARRSQH